MPSLKQAIEQFSSLAKGAKTELSIWGSLLFRVLGSSQASEYLDSVPLERRKAATLRLLLLTFLASARDIAEKTSEDGNLRLEKLCAILADQNIVQLSSEAEVQEIIVFLQTKILTMTDWGHEVPLLNLDNTTRGSSLRALVNNNSVEIYSPSDLLDVISYFLDNANIAYIKNELGIVVNGERIVAIGKSERGDIVVTNIGGQINIMFEYVNGTTGQMISVNPQQKPSKERWTINVTTDRQPIPFVPDPCAEGTLPQTYYFANSGLEILEYWPGHPNAPVS